MARIRIEGVGIVEVDDSFKDLSTAEQQQTVAEIKQAKLSQPSSALQVASAGGKGFNVGLLADTLGAPVDLVNWLLKKTREDP